MPPHLGAFSPHSSTPGARPGPISAASPVWEGADAERRKAKHRGTAPGLGASRAERGCAPSGAPLLNLDPSHIRCTDPAQVGEIGRAGPLSSTGEWFVRQKTIDGYTQIFAIDDPDHDFG